MRPAILLLFLACLTGCGGYVVLDSRSGGGQASPPRHVPAPVPHCHEITRQQAIDIAVAEASRQHCRYLQVQRVKRSRDHWTVELTAGSGRREHAEIRVKVDRRNGEVLSYKSKSVERKHHDHDDD